jgi:microcystin-dependent protein
MEIGMNRRIHRVVFAAALVLGSSPGAFACSPNPYVGQLCTVAQDWCPANTLPADGRLLPIRGNEQLFGLIGTIYGGDGSSTFALPDLRGRVVAHRGQGPGLAEVFIGDAFGSDSVVIGVANLPAHTHLATSTTEVTATLRGQRALGTSVSPGGNVLATFATAPVPPRGAPGQATNTDAYSNQAANVDMRDGAIAVKAAVATTTGIVGGGKPLDNAQPTLVLRQCIALVGQYPSTARAQPATLR